MFKIALRTFWSDIRALFQGWAMWVVLALMAFLVGLLPLIGDPESSVWVGCVYGVGASFLWVSPRFTRSFHVVPFTIEQIKKLAVYRCIIFLGVVMLIGGIYLALAVVFSWDWYRGFGMWYFFYAELYFCFLKERMVGFHEKKHKLNIWVTIWTIVVILASVLMMMGIAEALPLYVQYLIQAGLFILFIPFPVAVFKNMDFHDYRQVRDSVGGRLSFLE